jgi:hypothetical protein
MRHNASKTFALAALLLPFAASAHTDAVVALGATLLSQAV